MTDKLDLDVFAGFEPKPGSTTRSDRQLLTTLFALGREVASVLNLDELLAKLLREFLRKEARKNIGNAPRCPGHNNAHWFVWPNELG